MGSTAASWSLLIVDVSNPVTDPSAVNIATSVGILYVSNITQTLLKDSTTSFLCVTNLLTIKNIKTITRHR